GAWDEQIGALIPADFGRSRRVTNIKNRKIRIEESGSRAAYIGHAANVGIALHNRQIAERRPKIVTTYQRRPVAIAHVDDCQLGAIGWDRYDLFLKDNISIATSHLNRCCG